MSPTFDQVDILLSRRWVRLGQGFGNHGARDARLPVLRVMADGFRQGVHIDAASGAFPDRHGEAVACHRTVPARGKQGGAQVRLSGFQRLDLGADRTESVGEIMRRKKMRFHHGVILAQDDERLVNHGRGAPQTPWEPF